MAEKKDTATKAKPKRTPGQIRAQKENLQPVRSHEEAVEKGRRGGQVSTQRHRQRKTM